MLYCHTEHCRRTRRTAVRRPSKWPGSGVHCRRRAINDIAEICARANSSSSGAGSRCRRRRPEISVRQQAHVQCILGDAASYTQHHHQQQQQHWCSRKDGWKDAALSSQPAQHVLPDNGRWQHVPPLVTQEPRRQSAALTTGFTSVSLCVGLENTLLLLAVRLPVNKTSCSCKMYANWTTVRYSNIYERPLSKYASRKRST